MPYFKQQEVINAGIYMRLSVEDERLGESNSIKNQRMLLTDFVREKNMTLVDEYVDDGFSGTNFNRPGLKALMEDCRTQKINCILVKDLSRLGRDMTQVGRYIDETFPQMGIRFIAVNDSYDSNNNEYTGLDMVTPFKNLCNELYARDISKKIRATLDIAQKKGLVWGGQPPYGYMRDPEDAHHLVIDEPAAPVIRLIFELKIAGRNAQAIAKYLNDEGFETPEQRVKRLGMSKKTQEEVDGSLWKVATVSRILRDETYIGTVVSRKRQQPNYKIKTQKHNARESWIRVPGMHEPIITQEVFDYVQDLYERIHTSTAEGTVRPLTGFLRCADCGMLMNYKGSLNAKYQYIACSSYLHKEGCTPHHMNLKTVKGKVLAAIRELVEFLVRVRPMIAQDTDATYRKMRMDAIGERISAVVDEEKHLMALKTRLLEDRAHGMIPNTEYDEMSRYYTEALEDAERKIRELQDEKSRMFAEQKNVLAWMDSAIEFRGLQELTRKAVVIMIDYVYIGEGKSVDIHFRYREQLADIKRMMESRGQ
mgnify:FL=1